MEKPVSVAHNRLRVAALVDLPRSAQSGGHVKCWERLALAASQSTLPLDLTVYFSGPRGEEIINERARMRQLPPVFSTAKLRFLPYTPDFTDLAPYHAPLARELKDYDLIHSTDGFFAYAQTADRVSRKYGIPLTTSFHTDTPAYTRIFTKQAISKIFANWPWLKKKLIVDWDFPEHQGRQMEKKLREHLEDCSYALVTRQEDFAFAESVLDARHVKHLRLGVDKKMFGPHRRDREGIERDYKIPPGRTILLFVGRVDVGKNIHTLAEAMENLIKEGRNLHLLVAGVGPAEHDVIRHLGSHVSMPGFVKPDELARLYASVDALALCSEVEIRSMAGVEAMASSCPVLVSEKSGVAQLFNNTPAMKVVPSGIPSWEKAIREFILDGVIKQNIMRHAAVAYSSDHLASWEQVLAEDLFAVWQKAAAIPRDEAA
ncbi:MAG TPA: glycosyltransferase [Alphaproteobacteria bacterium]|nr:glycosyltransferase [Alphaproteobacteria bacterium]